MKLDRFTKINSVHSSYHHHHPEKYWISFFYPTYCCLAVTLVTTTIITLIAPRKWHHDKDVDILTYRDKSFASKFTGKMKVISCINLFKSELVLPLYRLMNATNFKEIIYFVLISIDF